MRIEIDLTDEELKALLLEALGYDERVMEVNTLDYDAWEKVLALVITNRPPAPAAKPQPPQGEDVSFTPPPAVEPAQAVPTVQPPPAATSPERKLGGYYPPMDYDARLGASIRCHCNTYGAFKGYGWVDMYGNLHTEEKCEGVDESTPVSDAAALSASRTGEHGTIDADDDIPF